MVVTRATAVAEEIVTGEDLDVHDLDVGPQTHIRAIGNPRRVIARAADGAPVMGGDIVACSYSAARHLCGEALRAIPCTEAGVALDGRERPAYLRGMVCMSVQDASAATGEDFHQPRTFGPGVLTYVAPDEDESNLITVALHEAEVTDLAGREYGPGTIVRGRRVVLSPLVARGRATVVQPRSRG